MKKRNSFTIFTVLVLLSMVLAACAPAATPQVEPTKAPEAAKPYRLALIQFLKGHPVHRLMQLGFDEGCKAWAQTATCC